MSIFRNIITAIRGKASQAGEAIVDSQAMTILEQEIRDAENGLEKSKVALTKLKSEEIRLNKEYAEVTDDINDYSNKAKQALDKGDEALAMQVAERIADLQSRQSEVSSERSSLATQVDKILRIINEREKQIRKNKVELQKAKTYEDLQKTQSSIAQALPTNDSSAKRVQRAMERVKQKQQDTENLMEAQEWMHDSNADNDLDAKLNAAGIGEAKPDASAILEKLKNESS